MEEADDRFCGKVGVSELHSPSGPIPSLAPELIQPGDLAITHSGSHLLVALGGTQWIQADPGEAAVITLDATTSTNGWLRPPVTLHRWSLLHPPP